MPDVEIYTSPFCGFCYRAKAILDDHGVVYTEHDVTAEPGARQRMMERAGGANTVPQIFIGPLHVGGCQELMQLQHDRKLAPLLAGKG